MSAPASSVRSRAVVRRGCDASRSNTSLAWRTSGRRSSPSDLACSALAPRPSWWLVPRLTRRAVSSERTRTVVVDLGTGLVPSRGAWPMRSPARRYTLSSWRMRDPLGSTHLDVLRAGSITRTGHGTASSTAGLTSSSATLRTSPPTVPRAIRRYVTTTRAPLCTEASMASTSSVSSSGRRSDCCTQGLVIVEHADEQGRAATAVFADHSRAAWTHVADKEDLTDGRDSSARAGRGCVRGQ